MLATKNVLLTILYRDKRKPDWFYSEPLSISRVEKLKGGLTDYGRSHSEIRNVKAVFLFRKCKCFSNIHAKYGLFNSYNFSLRAVQRVLMTRTVFYNLMLKIKIIQIN